MWMYSYLNLYMLRTTLISARADHPPLIIEHGPPADADHSSRVSVC